MMSSRTLTAVLRRPQVTKVFTERRAWLLCSGGNVRMFHVTPSAHQQQQKRDLTIDDLNKQQRVQVLKRHLADISRVSIPKSEFLQLAKDVAGLNESEANELLPHLHESGVALHYNNNPVLGDVVLTRPEKVTQDLARLLDIKVLERELEKHRQELERIEAEVAPMREQKKELDKRAKGRITTYLFMGLGYLVAQTTILAKMTWIDFGWDVVEPITYFFTFSVALIGYAYFLLLRREYTYSDLLNMLTNRRRRIEYQKNGFNYEKYAALEKQWRDKADQIRQECLWVYGEIPQEFHDTMERVRRQVAKSEIAPNKDLLDATRPEGSPHVGNVNEASTTLAKKSEQGQSK